MIKKTRQKNLKARRVNDAKMMSIDTSVDSAEDPSQATIGGWFDLDPAPAPTGKACPSSSLDNLGQPHGCTPKGKKCNGISYYKFGSISTAKTWHQAFELTPENCVLAPIGSEEELAEVYNQYQDLADSGQDGAKPRAWVGVRKSAFDAQNDNGGNGSRANWFNLDGTPAAVCDESAWAGNAGDQPNNSVGGRANQYLFMKLDDGRINDVVGNYDEVFAAIWKCCEEGVTFTPASCGVATADE